MENLRWDIIVVLVGLVCATILYGLGEPSGAGWVLFVAAVIGFFL